MIIENSGKIYRFKLDHNLGYGFAEVYDFTDESEFDGRPVFVFNKVDKELYESYTLDEIRSSGVALGPLAFFRFPNIKGVGAWKYLFQSKDFLLTERPPYKYLHSLRNNDNWSEFDSWSRGPSDPKTARVFVPYEDIRHLETRILNSTLSAVHKLTMKLLLDRGQKVSDYYDLGYIGNKNSFVQLINTYYPAEKTKEFLKQIPLR
jgi:hypothetical protein